MNVSLEKDLQTLLGVEEVYQRYEGAQKYVFIVRCDSQKKAVKVFRTGFGDREKRELEFYVKHQDAPGIPKVLDVVQYKHQTVIIEEYIDGTPLSELQLAFSDNESRVSELLRGVIDVMDRFWTDGVVHRDLKPDNILVQPDGSPVVIDFGILGGQDYSTLTATGFQPHTLLYAAPEQLAGQKDQISYRTDFFALGVIGYWLLFNRTPFGSTYEVIKKNFDLSVVPNDLSKYPTMALFLQRCLSINVSMRPRSSALLRSILS